MIKDSANNKSLEEWKLVCVVLLKSFLNGVLRLGRLSSLVTHEKECFHDQVNCLTQILWSATGTDNIIAASPPIPFNINTKYACLARKKSFQEHACRSTLIHSLNAHLLSV